MEGLLEHIDADLLKHHRDVQELQASLAQEGYSGAQLRRMVSHRGAKSIALRPASVECEDVRVPASGHELPLRLYRPGGAAPQRGLMMYFHGGGWVTGSVETHDSLCARISAETRYTVASVDYRLAPEHPFPAANEDALAATLWMLEQRGRFNIPEHLGWAMGGDSAGAHIALCTTMHMLQQGRPVCERLLLFYPPVAPGLATSSGQRYAHGPGLTAESMRGFWQAYAGAGTPSGHPPELDLRTWRELAALPPCVIMTAQHDILRDEGDQFAETLAQLGVTVIHEQAARMIHGFARMIGASEAASAHVASACASFLTL